MSQLIKVRSLHPKHTIITDNENYQIIWVSEGLDSIAVDFETITSLPNSIIFLTPGRVARLKHGCKPSRGWVLSFSRSFFLDQHLEGLNIRNVDVFHAYGEIPMIVLSPKIGDRIHVIAEMIAELVDSHIPNREVGISALLRTLLVYCDSKCNIRTGSHSNTNELRLVSQFKHLVSQHYLRYHQVFRYAEIMNVSPKYLSQVIKRVMGVSPKYVIQEQLLIQASRDLKFSNESIKEIAVKLGFSEPEHFSHFFKRYTGHSPIAFRKG